LWCWRNNYKGRKSYEARNTAHDKSNKHANDNLLHDIPFIVQPAYSQSRP
jgi:hypothetical protein